MKFQFKPYESTVTSVIEKYAIAASPDILAFPKCSANKHLDEQVDKLRERLGQVLTKQYKGSWLPYVNDIQIAINGSAYPQIHVTVTRSMSPNDYVILYSEAVHWFIVLLDQVSNYPRCEVIIDPMSLIEAQRQLSMLFHGLAQINE